MITHKRVPFLRNSIRVFPQGAASSLIPSHSRLPLQEEFLRRFEIQLFGLSTLYVLTSLLVYIELPASNSVSSKSRTIKGFPWCC